MYGRVPGACDERHMRSYRGPRHPSVIGHRPSIPLPAFSRLASPADLGSLADLLTRSLGSRLPYLLAPVSCASTWSAVLQLLARRVFPLYKRVSQTRNLQLSPPPPPRQQLPHTVLAHNERDHGRRSARQHSRRAPRNASRRSLHRPFNPSRKSAGGRKLYPPLCNPTSHPRRHDYRMCFGNR